MSREPYVGCIVDQHARHPRLQSILGYWQLLRATDVVWYPVRFMCVPRVAAKSAGFPRNTRRGLSKCHETLGGGEKFYKAIKGGSQFPDGQNFRTNYAILNYSSPLLFRLAIVPPEITCTCVLDFPTLLS